MDENSTNNDIWFDLCLGNIEVDEDGAHHFESQFTRLSHLSASNIADITKYREVLHRLLDKAIDHIGAIQKRVRNH